MPKNAALTRSPLSARPPHHPSSFLPQSDLQVKSAESTRSGLPPLASLPSTSPTSPAPVPSGGSPPPHPDSLVRWLVLDLFSGMNGLGHGIGRYIDNCSSVFVALFEVDARCRKVLKKSCHSRVWLSDLPDLAGTVGSVFWLVEGGLSSLIDRFSGLKGVLIVGGSPCVGFSAANPSRPGAASTESQKIWIFPVLVSMVLDRNLIADWVVENVSMEPVQEERVSRLMGCKPQVLDNATVNPASRVRLFWHNQQPRPLVINNPVKVSQVIDKGWIPAWAFEDNSAARIDSKHFGTFLRPFPPGKPYECPASFWRLPLSCYSRSGLVIKQDLTVVEKSRVTSWLASSVDISTRDLKTAGSQSLKARLSLASFIHVQGGDSIIRPLLAHERELCLGFPVGAGALEDEPPITSSWQWERMQLSGNSFSPDVIRHILEPWCLHVSRGDALERRQHRPSARTRQEALDILLPGR